MTVYLKRWLRKLYHKIRENKRMGYVAYLYVLFKGGQVYVETLYLDYAVHKVSLCPPVTRLLGCGPSEKAR